ncbi:MAG: hypothetical protein DCF19_18590 [Pseudanabaena frigida]|uniref:Membrane protein insertion efficiency factor YidD n=1 Tax=Pseudanabaena frigida TaxID=945775 RepID=A0A2W4XPI1_9CYAN|nr:MAG: hypothetical protein DCF19_18590 [Pseudanabaena frigida]
MQKRISSRLPIANILDVASRGLAVTAIRGYQKFISPYKGFSCAHRVLYGCESCSQYFKRVITEEGIFTAIANSKERFQECREANEILKKRRAKYRARGKYYASRLKANTVAMESDDLENPDISDADIPEDTDTSEESENTNKNRLGGSQWGRKLRSQANNSNGSADNNCDYCSDCADGINMIPSDCLDDHNCNHPFEAMDCPDLSCPDLSCGNADCLSGMDCSGLDCGGLDCNGCGDCGSCG